jgi:hypothetical protein
LSAAATPVNVVAGLPLPPAPSKDDAAAWPPRAQQKIEEGKVISRLARVAFAAFVLASTGLHPLTTSASDTVSALLDSMGATQPDWLPSLDKCPADAMPARETAFHASKERCESALEQCLRNCRVGDANDCYASAVALQKVRNSSIPQALFLRACELGVVSGCTNRAAGMDSGKGSPCAIRTFAAACNHSDPWACTMIGLHLVRGIGVDKDHKRARQLLSRSCGLGDGDEACVAAKALMKEIGD